MKLNPNDRKLAIVLKAMEEVIVPELTSSGAQSAAGMIIATLTDILKQEHGSVAILQECIGAGVTLANEISAQLGSSSTVSELSLAEADSLAKLLPLHETLTAGLAQLCEQLSASTLPAESISATLRRAAEWELSYYTCQAALPVPELARVETAGSPLSKELLQDYLNSLQQDSGDGIEVTGFRPLPGGFGKQTYLCEYRDPNGVDHDLVVRKTDPTPIMMHGACDLENECELLTALAKVDYPSPKPLHFAASFKDVDGSFYTMDKIAGSPPGGFLDGVSGEVDERVFLELAELLGRLHSLPMETFADYIHKYDDPRILEATTEECYRYNLEGWERYMQQQEHLPSPYMFWLLDWLKRNIPKDTRKPILIHGDFNIHNVLVDADRVTAVLDWECAGFGAPEQDLAYIQPHISKHIDWDRFVQHYRDHGGKDIDPAAMPFGLVYSALRTNLAGNRGTHNLQVGANEDVRYAMVELGFTASFMGMALQSAKG